MSNENETKCCNSNANPENCPVVQATEMWEQAFCSAMQAAMSERLRQRIEKSWGPLLDSEADAALEAVTAGWQVKVSQIKAKLARDSFKESIVKNWLGCEESGS